MAAQTPTSQVIRFGLFEVDLRSGELHKAGLKIKLREQSFQILALLLERPGEMVTREELQLKLWPNGTFVDFDHSLNAAINRLREALDDPAEHPRFIETLPRRGYRFIYPVAAVYSPPVRDDGDIAATSVGARHGVPLLRRWIVAATCGAVIATFAVLLVFNVAGLRDRLMVAVGARRAVPTPKIDSLAVLPLENLSGDPEQEYFADGMTEGLITELGQIGSLRVISRTSVMRYKGTKKPLPEIAKELNVDAVVEGAVLRSGDRVRITANLIHAPTDRHLWAEAYDRDLRDVLSLQSEIARTIANEVKVKVTPDVQARLARAHAVNPEALDLYLKGIQPLSRDEPKKALDYFQQAVRKDSNFARAYLGIAWAFSSLGDGEELPSSAAYPQTKAYALKALELDDNLAEAHAALAKALVLGDWDWRGCERELKRALEINPNSWSAHGMYGGFLYLMGRSEESIAEARRALEINPDVAGPRYNLASAYFFGRRYDDAIAQCQDVLVFDPKRCSDVLGWSYREKGMYKEAVAEFLKQSDIPPKWGHLGNTYARAGSRTEARKAIQRLIEMSKQRVGTYSVALVYSGLGDKDRAIEWLEKAYQVRDKGLCYMKVDPALDPLRSDPRFQDLLRRMNFPP